NLITKTSVAAEVLGSRRLTMLIPNDIAKDVAAKAKQVMHD
ncbi:MAG: hypothetical protein ACI805_001193, partial [Candidatus Azotimanducaceae bacterium]